MKPLRRHGLKILATVIVVAALVLFARHVDWRSVMKALHGVDAGLLLAAIGVNLISLAMKGAQWWVLLRKMGVKSLWLVTRATTIGAALNTLLIAQGGEGARVLIVSRSSGVSSARVLAALALDRVIDLVSFAAILAAAASLMDLPADLKKWRSVAFGMLLFVVIGLVFLGRTSMTLPALKADALLESVGSRVRSYLNTLAASAREMTSVARLSGATALSLGAWLLQIVTYHLVAMAAHSTLPLAGSVAAQLACTLGFIIRATPGNVGIFQVVYVLAVRPFGVTDSAAVAIAIVIQAIQVIPTLLAAAAVAPGINRRRSELLGA
jgi:uncharacterized protein (TIRG00374 family)